MRYVVTGGGTGGHVTPIKHVAASLSKIDKEAKIAYVGQKGDEFAKLIKNQEVDVKNMILAGKFRRYQRPFWQTLIDIQTHLLNIRDAFYVLAGYIQSLLFLRKFGPDAVFVKGGYVGVPVGMAAATLGIPIVTHDSDMTPGIANKIIGKWAKYNAVASIFGDYPYSKDKTRVVGVPISEKFFQKIDDKRQLKAKQTIGAGDSNYVILVVGGSLGAKAINDAMIAIAPDLIDAGLEVFHVAGSGNYEDVKKQFDKHDLQDIYHLISFISDQDELVEHYIAADLVISRAGATNTAEIAGLAKPAIIIPGQQLADQKANAEELEKADAAIILQDKEITDTPDRLYEAINLAIIDEELRSGLAKNISAWSNSNAAKSLAEILVEVARG